MSWTSYEPDGFRFFDITSCQDTLLIHDGSKWDGWLAQRDKEKRWTPIRKATEEDLVSIDHSEHDGRRALTALPKEPSR